MNLFELCKISRQEKKLTLLALAELSQISYSMLYRFEEGEIPDPHPHLLKKIATALSLSYLELMQMAGYLDAEKNNEHKSDSHQTSLPFFDWSSLTHLSTTSFHTPLYSSKQFYYCQQPLKATFAVQLNCDDFEPIFLKNSILAFYSPEYLNLTQQNYVLYRSMQQRQASLAQVKHFKKKALYLDLSTQNLFSPDEIEIMAVLNSQIYP